MKKRALTTLFSLIATSAIFLSACAAAASFPVEDKTSYPEGIGGGGAPAFEPSFTIEEFDETGESFAREAPASLQAAERLVIKSANLSIVVTSPDQRMEEIAAMAERLGGFVVSSSIYQTYLNNGGEATGAYITIRVPSELFQQALDDIRAGAVDVPTDNQSGQDVTAEYTDLQSRLRNLESAEDMLRQIMEDATDTEDVLNAFNQLNYITEQIEVLKGQIQYYEESSALSAISVELIANEAVQPIQVNPWDLSAIAKQAIEALIRALQGIAEALVWFALYVLPIVLVIGLPVVLIGWGLRRWLAKRTLPKTVPAKRKK
ncbi:MAG: DUF4349 domain-containing protein [Anaerolineales bacterium]